MTKNKKEYWKEYYLKNVEQKKEYYLKNREQKKEYYLKNKEQRIEYQREYDSKNKEQKKEYYLKNVEHITKRICKHNSKPEIQEMRRNREKNKYKTDINYRILKLCRSRVLHAIKNFNKSASTMELIGCTPDELRQHLESQFKPGMNWENQGRGGWDIEHIKACFHFNMEDPQQQRACFNWSNLQPMEHIENI